MVHKIFWMMSSVTWFGSHIVVVFFKPSKIFSEMGEPVITARIYKVAILIISLIDSEAHQYTNATQNFTNTTKNKSSRGSAISDCSFSSFDLFWMYNTFHRVFVGKGYTGWFAIAFPALFVYALTEGFLTFWWFQTPNGLPNMVPYPLHVTVKIIIITSPISWLYEFQRCQ